MVEYQPTGGDHDEVAQTSFHRSKGLAGSGISLKGLRTRPGNPVLDRFFLRGLRSSMPAHFDFSTFSLFFVVPPLVLTFRRFDVFVVRTGGAPMFL